VSDALSIGVVCYPSFGGSGIVASELAVGIAKRGHQVHVISSAPPRRRLPPCENLHFHEVGSSSYPLFEHTPYTLALACAIVRVAREQRLDLLHVHYAVPHTASAYLARQTLGAAAPRIVTTLHGTDLTRVGVDPNYESVTRFTAGSSDAITTPSAYLGREAERFLDMAEPPPVEVIPNFVDVERFAPPPDKADPGTVAERAQLLELFGDGRAGASASPSGPMLFHVSNFRPIKRVGDTIDVLARVRQQLPARLLLIGDGPERAAVAQRARQLGVQDSVCFLGRRVDFAAQLKHADAFLLPSESEGFGLAALEAMSSGVPVFGYRVGGLPEVISEDVGRLVLPFDVAALGDAVLEVLADQPTQLALGQAGRARALTQFRAEPALDRYERFYREVLDGSSPRRSG
jgi:L-malate glycosyltransferase